MAPQHIYAVRRIRCRVRPPENLRDRQEFAALYFFWLQDQLAIVHTRKHLAPHARTLISKVKREERRQGHVTDTHFFIQFALRALRSEQLAIVHTRKHLAPHARTLISKVKREERRQGHVTDTHFFIQFALRAL